MGGDLQRAEYLGFSVQRRIPGKVGARTRTHLLRIFLECVRGRQDALDSGSGAESLHRSVLKAGTDACGVGLFCIVAATGQRFFSTFTNETDYADAVDRRRQVVRQRARRANEAGRDRRNGRWAPEYWSLDPRGATERNNRRAG